MNWIKGHKFWVGLVMFVALAITLDATTGLNVSRTAGRITVLAIIIKLISYAVGYRRTRKTKEGE